MSKRKLSEGEEVELTDDEENVDEDSIAHENVKMPLRKKALNEFDGDQDATADNTVTIPGQAAIAENVLDVEDEEVDVPEENVINEAELDSDFSDSVAIEINIEPKMPFLFIVFNYCVYF